MSSVLRGYEVDHVVGPVDDEIDDCVRLWFGTPYRPNMRMRGIGVDCRTFVAAVIDKAMRIDTPLPPVPVDIGQHDPQAAAAAVKVLIRAYRARNVTHDKIVQAGDVLAVRMENCAAPTHCAIVTGMKGSIAHAHRHAGVTYGSLADQRIVAVYRPDWSQLL